jgi:hypothetical protein
MVCAKITYLCFSRSVQQAFRAACARITSTSSPTCSTAQHDTAVFASQQ